MQFERETNIYGDEAILKRFQANETSISIVQGNISAIISESELVELENSNATMYSKLASAVMDIDSLTLNFSDLTTKYNTVSGQYTSLNSQVAQYKASVDGLSADITSVQTTLSNNYSTTTQMTSAINAKASEITASVSGTYATKSALNTANNKIRDLETWQSEASLKITDSAIISTVTQSSTYETSVNSLIEQKASSIRLKATTISWSSTYSSMTSSGTLTCRNATIEGTIHSDNGDDEIYMRSARLDFIRDGEDVGFIGTNAYSSDNTKKGLVFDLEYDAAYMAWSVKKTSSAATYTMMWAYANKDIGAYAAGMLHAGCDIDLHNYYLRNAKIANLTAPNNYLGWSGEIPIITRIEDAGNGAIRWWSSTITVSGGIITSAPS